MVQRLVNIGIFVAQVLLSIGSRRKANLENLNVSALVSQQDRK